MPGRSFFLLLLVLTVSATAHAQSDTTGPLLITRSSIYRIDFNKKIWRFSPADLPNGADTSLPDGDWPLTDPALHINDSHTSAAGFRGIGWLRLHFQSDSSLTGIPLSMQITQDGASEIYLDGRLLDRYGVLAPADSAEYYTPKERPLPFVLLRPGPHLLAVRYANWRYLKNLEDHGHYKAGFELDMATANGAMEIYAGNGVKLTFVMALTTGVFLTLALIHLILFMYYRAERANLRFALFAFCFGMMFLLPLLSRLGDDPVRNMHISKLTAGFLVCTGLTLSFLLNSLFPSKRWHFYLVIAVCLVHAVFLLFLNNDYIQTGTVAVIGTVSLEAVYILIRAMVRRQPGARIIGFGLFLLLGLLLVLVGSILLLGDFVLKDDNPLGIIVTTLFLLSIVIIPLSMSAYLAWRFAHVSRNLQEQLQQVEALNADRQRLLENRQEELEREVALRTEELRREKQQSDDLLLNILPAEVASELKEKGRSEARHYDNVSVLFTDFVDFTQLSETMTPTALVAEIDACFKAFDGIVEHYGLEKIKTVGDAYIAVSGLPTENPAHGELVVRAAIDIRDFMEARQRQTATFRIRLGVHSGPVVAGIVGVKKFAYDIWGDTVNTAARMEQHSEAGRINISAATHALVKDRFQCSYRGSIAAKHKGEMEMYFVTSPPSPLQQAGEG